MVLLYGDVKVNLIDKVKRTLRVHYYVGKIYWKISL